MDPGNDEVQTNGGNLLGTIKSLDNIGPTSLNCTENANIRVRAPHLRRDWAHATRICAGTD